MSVKTNLTIDLVIAGAFLFVANPPIAGLRIHEWVGLAFGAAIVAHLVLHWEWMTTASTRLFTKGGRDLRLNSVVDACLFLGLVASVLSGLLTSRHVLPWFGVSAEPAPGWRGIHSLAANVSVVAMGLHLGLHWNWIALNVRRLVGRPAASAVSVVSRGAKSPATEASFAGDNVK
jgi:hypothetical protein